MLRRICRHDPAGGSAYTYAYATLGELIAWIIGWDLTLEYAMGASTVSSGWSNHFIEFLRIFHLKIPLWLAYDHWTGLRAAVDQIARQETLTVNPAMLPGSQAFLHQIDHIKSAPSADILARAHALLAAPQIFGVEIGFNLPAFLIALLITAILVIGIKESARFNAGIVVMKVSVVLFVLALGSQFVNTENWGNSWSTFAPYGFSGIGAAAGLHILRLHRVRRRFDHGAGSQEPAARSAHRPLSVPCWSARCSTSASPRC